MQIFQSSRESLGLLIFTLTLNEIPNYFIFLGELFGNNQKGHSG